MSEIKAGELITGSAERDAINYNTPMNLIDSKPRGSYISFEIPDGRVIDVSPLTLGRARITVSHNQGSLTWEDGW